MKPANLTVEERINLLKYFRDHFDEASEDWNNAIQLAYQKNSWFTPENIRQAWRALKNQYLSNETLDAITRTYPELASNAKSLHIGIIMAGNIPMVGIHDLLCVFLAGHTAHIKLSSKDDVLLPFITSEICHIDERFESYVKFEERLKGLDAYIATGSDNSVRYFEAYFGKYPSIIRRNRSSIAVLTGSESEEDLIALGKDVFSYFGLGCRSVSKLYVPEGYNFEKVLGLWQEKFIDVINHNAYKNNYDYSYTLYLLNKVKFLMNGCVLLTEDDRLSSRIAMLHYETYTDFNDIESKIETLKTNIQCIVGDDGLPLKVHITPFGKAQQPDFMDYADGIDTISFLNALS